MTLQLVHPKSEIHILLQSSFIFLLILLSGHRFGFFQRERSAFPCVSRFSLTNTWDECSFFSKKQSSSHMPWRIEFHAILSLIFKIYSKPEQWIAWIFFWSRPRIFFYQENSMNILLNNILFSIKAWSIKTFSPSSCHPLSLTYLKQCVWLLELSTTIAVLEGFRGLLFHDARTCCCQVSTNGRFTVS